MASNAIHLHPYVVVHFVTHTTKWTRDTSALCWRPGSFRSRIVFLSFLVPAVFYRSIPTWNEVLQKLFPLVSVIFGVFQNQPYNSFHLDITLQTSMFIASNQIVSATHLNIPEYHHTADEYIFVSNERFLCWRWKLWQWRRTCFALEINTLVLETDVLKRAFESFSHTHTHTQS